MKALVSVIALLSAILIACTSALPSEDTARRDALVAAVAAADVGDTVELTPVLGEDWDTLVVLGPYSDNGYAAERLGFPFAIEDVSPWTSSEGGSTFVLARNGGLVAWFNVRSTDVTTFCLGGDRLEAGSDVLITDEGITWKGLADPVTGDCLTP